LPITVIRQFTRLFEAQDRVCCLISTGSNNHDVLFMIAKELKK